MNFLQAVNRVLRTNAIIKGDDDQVQTFSDTQHAASLNLAIIAIQDELNDLVSDRLISYERAQASLSLSAGTRTYALASNFVRFYATPMFLDVNANRDVFEYPGGEPRLRLEIFDYKTQPGTPNWWYWHDATTKQVAFYQVPETSYTYDYEYEKDVSVTASTDTLPFHTESEAQAFCSMAARRFKALLEELPDAMAFVLRDPTWITAKARLTALIRPTNPCASYSVGYR